MAIVQGLVRARRADKILDAIKREIDKRRSSLNNDHEVQSITLVVKMKHGTETPRAVLMSVQTEAELGE